MKRVLAVLVGAGVAVGGGVAAWAAPGGGGPDRVAARACASATKAADPGIDRAARREAVKRCLADQGITVKERTPPTPEQQARRDALRACREELKGADTDRAARREAARACLEKAGVAPDRMRNRLSALKECRATVHAADPDADRAARRDAVRKCLQER